MYKVYILKSKVDVNKTYVGQTIKDVKERLNEHNQGLSPYTKAYRPWELIYFEHFYCKTCTDKRELFLKSGIGFRFRKLIAAHFKEFGSKELSSALQNGE